MLKKVSTFLIFGLTIICIFLCLVFYTSSSSFAQEVAQGIMVIKGIVLNGESVTSASGEVMVKSKGRWADAGVGLALMAGDEVKTGNSSQVWVEFAGGGEGVIGSRSHFKVKGNRTLLGIIGEIWLRVRGRFRVETERVAAAVTGTEFGIEIKSDGRMVLVVLDGSVSVEGPSGSAQVKGSEFVEVDPQGSLGRTLIASGKTLNRTWEPAWEVRGVVSGMVAEVAFVSGNATVERDGQSIPVELEMALFEGDRLSTPENARVGVRSGDRAALNIKGGIEGLDVAAVVLSTDPIVKLWAKTVWNRVQRVMSGGTPSTITTVGGVRGAEGDKEEDFEFLVDEEEEKVITPSEVEIAIISLQKVAEEGGPEAEEALYLIAESYKYLSEIYYKRVLEDFPEGKYTHQAQEQVEGRN